jgi:membrane protein
MTGSSPPAPRVSFRPGPRALRAYVHVRSFVREMDRSRTFGVAAELGFWLFFSLVPLVAVAGMIAAKLAVGHASLSGQAFASIPMQTRELINRQLASVAAWHGRKVGVQAAIVFVWMASSGVHAVFEHLEIKSGTQRAWVRRRLLAIGTCIALSIGGAVLALIATGVAWIEALLRGALPGSAWHVHSGLFETAVRLVIGFVVSVGLVAGVYRVGMPRAPTRVMPVLPGAVVAVLLHFGLGAAYVAYLSQMGIGGAYLAGLAVIAVTLMALYIFALALLLGAQLNCRLAERRGPRAAAQDGGSEGS